MLGINTQKLRPSPLKLGLRDNMYIEVKLEHDPQVQFNNFDEVNASIKEWQQIYIYQAGMAMESRAKEILREKRVRPIPFDAGNLSRAIHMTFDAEKPKARVGVDMRKAPYGEWVEFGHAKKDGGWWEGYHYLGGAAREVNAVLDSDFKASFSTELRRYKAIKTPKGMRILRLRQMGKGRYPRGRFVASRFVGGSR